LINDFNMNKIFCFGDGFATGHIWPEWPQILQVLAPQYQVINTAGIGAGSEFLVSGFVDLIKDMQDSIVIFQWPSIKRFDKMLQDDSWQSTISNDPVYHFNFNTDLGNRSWWLSSTSTNEEIKNYHTRFVQSQQHARRQQVYRTLVSNTCNNLNCRVIYTSTYEQDRFSRSTRFKLNRQDQIQPSPIVHFYWLIEEILPHVDIVIDRQRQKTLETIINQTTWTPYDPDREEIWSQIKNQLAQ
jgi:hypothetical protein